MFTNLTHDHQDQHPSPEHYFASKAQLFHALPAEGAVAVVNGCDEASELLLEITPPGARRFAYGARSRGAPQLPLAATAGDPEITLEGTAADIELGAELGGGSVRLSTRAVGEVFLENALAAYVTCLALGAPRGALLARLAEASPPRGRFEVVGRKPTVVVDYAHTPDALERTVATARALTHGQVTIVFGAGGHRDRAKRPLMGAAVARADRVILTSDNTRDEDPAVIARAIAEGIPAGVATEVELDREQAIRRAVLEATPEDVIVVAGKGHESTQTVGSVATAFSDTDVARAVLAARWGEGR